MRGVTSTTGSSTRSVSAAGCHALGTTNGAISTTGTGGGGTGGVAPGNRRATAAPSRSYASGLSDGYMRCARSSTARNVASRDAAPTSATASATQRPTASGSIGSWGHCMVRRQATWSGVAGPTPGRPRSRPSSVCSTSSAGPCPATGEGSATRSTWKRSSVGITTCGLISADVCSSPGTPRSTSPNRLDPPRELAQTTTSRRTASQRRERSPPRRSRSAARRSTTPGTGGLRRAPGPATMSDRTGRRAADAG